MTSISVSLKHLGLPIIAVGRMAGEELRVRRREALRKIYLEDDHIVGLRLTGDVSAAGILRGLMNKRVDVSPHRRHLLEPNFGLGVIEQAARSGWVAA